MESQIKYIIRIATSDDDKYTTGIINEMTCSATNRGTNVTPRTPDFLVQKMKQGLSVIAINPENEEWAGFCYLEVWQHEKYIANSGLIVSSKYRGMGISKEIKIRLFELGREKFPNARILSLTTSPAVIHINTELGYKSVPYSVILNDKLFLKGRNSWVNFTDLMNNGNPNSHYVAMLFDPVSAKSKKPTLPDAKEYLLKAIKPAWKKENTKITIETLMA